jgi:AraC family transcriptional regulator of adaptative response/methylated-DNA-[protein]-cysteine methyltransferase
MSTQMEALAAGVRTDGRWEAVLHRSAEADGTFYYAVRTTGVYCRPSCAARTPRPENVEFHATTGAAEAAGFRACLRCKPDQPALAVRNARIVADLCRFIDQADAPPTLDDLSARAALSAHHLHRLFTSVTGVTPRAYAAARRSARVKDELGRGDGATVTRAVFGAGYASTGRFYETAGERLGMTPTRYRAGGASTEIRFAVGECSLGSILVATSARGVCAIALGDDPDALVRDLQDRFPRAALLGGDAGFEGLVAQVIGFVEAPRLGLDLPLDIRGTAFQERVWQALLAIPPGTTAPYTDIAARIGSPAAVRAVARACGENPIAVAVPCHRVVRRDGDLSGYRWGVERKRALLDREAAR